MSKNVAKMSHFFDLYLTVYKGLSLFSVAVLFSLKKKKKKLIRRGYRYMINNKKKLFFFKNLVECDTKNDKQMIIKHLTLKSASFLRHFCDTKQHRSGDR